VSTVPCTLKEMTEVAIKTLVELATRPGVSDETRLEAAKTLLVFAWDQPKEPAE
jgi:hypothetical protein